MATLMDAVYNFNLIRRNSSVGSTGDVHSNGRLLKVMERVQISTLHRHNVADQVALCFEELKTDIPIDRVCLSISPRYSRKLTILSSWDSTKAACSDLVDGYSCFVSPGSSLLTNSKLIGKRARVRKYDDLNVILRSFIETHQPVQRTIGKLAQAGIRSGLTIALDTGDWGTAFLFLNSKNEGAFDGFPEKFTLSLRTMQELLKEVTEQSTSYQLTLDQDLIDIVDRSYVPNTLSTMHLEAAIIIALADRHKFTGTVSICGPEDNEVLYPAHTALLLLMIAIESIEERLDSENLSIQISLNALSRRIALRISTGCDYLKINPSQADLLKRVAWLLGFHIGWSDTGFVISTEFQHASQLEANCGYSVF